MIKSNLINNKDNSIAVDLRVEGEQSKIVSEFVLILYNLLSNKIVEKDSIDMFTEIVMLAIKETGNDFQEFAKGVVNVYYKNQKSKN